MNEETILDFINKVESETVEFKARVIPGRWSQLPCYLD